MIYKLTASDPVSPVSITEMRQELRQPPEDENTWIGRLLVSATATVEELTGLALSSRAFVYEATRTPYMWPEREASFVASQVCLPRGPVTGITGISVFDRVGVETALVSGTDFYPYLPTGIVTLEYISVGPGGRIRVEFTAGYESAAEVPQPIRDVIALIVRNRYLNPSTFVTGTVVAKIPEDARSMLLSSGYLRVSV